MNSDGEIYRMSKEMEASPEGREDAARLDGFLRGRAEADLKDRAKAIEDRLKSLASLDADHK